MTFISKFYRYENSNKGTVKKNPCAKEFYRKICFNKICKNSKIKVITVLNIRKNHGLLNIPKLHTKWNTPYIYNADITQIYQLDCTSTAFNLFCFETIIINSANIPFTTSFVNHLFFVR